MHTHLVLFGQLSLPKEYYHYWEGFRYLSWPIQSLNYTTNLYNFEFICPSWLEEGRFDLIVLGFARSRGWTCSHAKSKTNDIANYSSIPFSYSWARHYSLLCLPECLALLLRSIDHKNIRHLYPVSSIHTKTRTILLNHFRY